MKKTVALIYRLIFILLSVWALCSYIGIFTTKAFSDLSVFSDTVNAVAALAVFLWSIKSVPPEAVLKAKAVFAALAVAVLFANRSYLLSPADLWWIINVLLPAMAVLDWILFDKKGLLKIWDLLLWLLAALGLMALSGFNPDGIMSALMPALAFLGLMLLLSNLFSGKKQKKDTLSLLFEMGFLVMECYGFYLLSGFDVERFVNNLTYYTSVSNLIALAVVAVAFIIRLAGFKKAGTHLCRIKGCAVILLFAAFVFYTGFLHDFLGGNLSRYHMIHSIICPGLLLIGFVLFDSKGSVRWFDPLWWSVPVLMYGVFLFVYPFQGYKDAVLWLDFTLYSILSVVFGYLIIGIERIRERIT